MRTLGAILVGIAVVAAGVVYSLKIGRRDRGLDAVALQTQQYWTADFRNVSRHLIAGKPWLCGEVSQPSASGYARFVVMSGGEIPVIQGRDRPDLVDWAWAHYCT